MSILASLARAYDRLPDAPPFGYSLEQIGILISLNEDGSVANVIDWRDRSGKKAVSRPMLVPQAVKRSSGISPNFLWDKTAYVLGVTAGDGKRTAAEHLEFVERHLRDIGESDDLGLKAFVAFLKAWTPEQFCAPLWPDDLKDLNVAFTLESDRLSNEFLHMREAAKALWQEVSTSGSSDTQICLVTGRRSEISRLHPSIKGVWGAQSSGASLVSFNLDAFTSYGHEQGDNAAVSTAATFAYSTALSRFLEKDSGHRIQIADTSTVFWADTSDMAKDAEDLFAGFFDDAQRPEVEDKAATSKIREKLALIRKGVPLESVEPQLAKGVRFYVLGLAPNAARLSVRFYYDGDFGPLTTHYQRFIEDMRVEPAWPFSEYPSLWQYLRETALLKKQENIAPNLAGELVRALLSGAHYPLSLMSSILTRIRADGEVNALRASILKAVLTRNFNVEAPVALDTENTNRGYLLGRLFAVYEEIQRSALGGKVNATIKDKFYGSASATPRKVFAVLNSGSANHLSKLRKLNPGREVNLDRLLRSILDLMVPSDEPLKDPFPASLNAQEQALFGLGYYHQRSDFFKSKTDVVSEGDAE